VADVLPTDTTAHAHLVLPAASMLEDDDLVGAYGHHWLGNTAPVVPPDGARTDVQIAFGLARRLGVPVDEDVRAWKRKFIHPNAGLSLEALEAGAVRSPLAPEQLWAEGRVATPDGRVRLLTDAPALAPADPAFPLSLFSISTDFSQSSQWVDVPEGPVAVRVHPDVSPVPDGAVATLRSVIGALTVRVRHDGGLRRDVVVIPKGGGYARGHCANAITRARLTDIGEGGALYEEGVRLEAAC
jgi:anaerobic selenocysteine-containing dehydrogenase